ncbi:DUF1868 domain-containing protein [Streptomyces sp. bgisy084]|uniref:DUF1868 domain-containing protein n=1 Tax=unclassified Streptomyces TaxID=2593676 RepID=UPI003D741AC7
MNALHRRSMLLGTAGALATGLALPGHAAAEPIADTAYDAGNRKDNEADSGQYRAPLAAGPGMKWDLDGNAQRFRGNTFVCRVPQDSAFFKAEQQAMALMKDSDLAPQYVCLPHNSLHMTVFDVITQNHVKDKTLPAWLADCTDVSQASQRVLARLQAQGSGLTPLGPINMKVKGFRPFEANFTMDLTPADDATHNALWRARRELSALLEVRAANFDTYQFHSTIGYRLVQPVANDYPKMRALEARLLKLFTGAAATVTMEHPAFNLFDDMLAFPQLWLTPRA